MDKNIGFDKSHNRHINWETQQTVFSRLFSNSGMLISHYIDFYQLLSLIDSLQSKLTLQDSRSF